MRHCGLISGFIQQAPKEPYITQRLLINRGIRQKMMALRSLQDPGDTGKSSSRRQADARSHIKAVFSHTVFELQRFIWQKNGHTSQRRTKVFRNKGFKKRQMLTISQASQGSRPWHGLFQCISIFEISASLSSVTICEYAYLSVYLIGIPQQTWKDMEYSSGLHIHVNLASFQTFFEQY